MFSKGFQKYQYMWSHKQLIKREEEKGYKLTKQSRIFHTLRGTLLQHSCIAFSFHGLSPIFLSHSRLFSTHPLLCVSLSLHPPLASIQPLHFVSLHRSALTSIVPPSHLSLIPFLTFSLPQLSHRILIISDCSRGYLLLSLSALLNLPLFFGAKSVGVEQRGAGLY